MTSQTFSDKADLETLEWLAKRQRYDRLKFFKPYPKQMDFIEQTASLREVLLMAGNQLGKSEVGAFVAACHLTGEYPSWWRGRRWDRPVKGWAAGETSLLVRDVQQKKLCGEPGVEADHGSGFIPKRCFTDKPSLSRGVTDAYDTIQVRHRSGGTSVLRFKSYEQGRSKFQGETLDFIWLDEEPPMDVYSECLTRVTATNGMVYVTFTPLKGKSEVVCRYLDEPSNDRGVVSMTLTDAGHIAPEDRAKIIAGYPAHERDARVRGIPIFGDGKVFAVVEETISEEPITHIPAHWAKLWGIDFGVNHPFAAVLCLWDRDNDVIHVHHGIKIKDGRARDHAAAMKPTGAGVPVAWPHDGTQREKGSGETLSALYKAEGLLMLPEHATWPDGGYSVEACIKDMFDRMTTGRLKVAAHLGEWFNEFRQYHRKDGQLVKINDDLLSATMKVIMMKRKAQVVALGSEKRRRRNDQVADGLDFDFF